MKKFIVRLTENSKRDYPFTKEYRFDTIEEAKTCFAEKVETTRFCYQDNDVFETYNVVVNTPTEFKVENVKEPDKEYYRWTLLSDEEEKTKENKENKENKEEEFTMAKEMKIKVRQVPPCQEDTHKYSRFF